MSKTTASSTHTHRTFSRDEWQAVHDGAAGLYQSSEFFRETVLGIARLRRTMFASVTGHVLDVACGYGTNFRYLSNASRITGVDFSPVMLKRAERNVQGLVVPVDLQQGDAEALDFPDGHFDAAVSTFTTCSLLDPVAALREIGRVVKPGGRIVLLEHGRSRWEWFGRYQDRTAADTVEQAGCRWNQNPLQLVREAGLVVKNTRRSHVGIVYLIEAAPVPS